MSTIQDHPKLPKYYKLAEQLREQMQKGELAPGARLPSLADMQTQFGVSIGTVDKAHSLLERDGLVVREQGRGTFVAERVAPKATGLIGFLGSAFSGRRKYHAHAAIAEGIEEIVLRAEKRVLLLDAASPVGWDRVDGILVCSPGEAPSIIGRLPFGLPCVSLLKAVAGTSSVIVDESEGYAQAVKYLAELGHRRIGCLVQDDPERAERIESYRAALRASGIEAHPAWLRQSRVALESPDEESSKSNGYERWRHWGRRSMEAWLRDGWHASGCTALMAQNDHAAIGVLDALREANIQVPAQVSVLGHDGVEFCDYVTPTLSAIEVPLHQVGAAGVELLLSQIARPDSPPQTIVLPTRLHARASIAPPPADSND